MGSTGGMAEGGDCMIVTSQLMTCLSWAEATGALGHFIPNTSLLMIRGVIVLEGKAYMK